MVTESIVMRDFMIDLVMSLTERQVIVTANFRFGEIPL